MSAEALTTSGYIKHHLTNLTYGEGFWAFHLDSLNCRLGFRAWCFIINEISRS